MEKKYILTRNDIINYNGHILYRIQAVFGINNNWLNLDYIFENYKFADGTPFGVKE